MNKVSKFFGGLAVIASVALSGCETPEQKEDKQAIRGIVIAEKYISPAVVSRDTAAFGNETLRLGDSSYTLQIQTQKHGIYTVSVSDGIVSSLRDSFLVKKESVDLAVDIGADVELLGKPYEFYRPGSVFGINANQIVVVRPAATYKPTGK